MSFKKIMVDRLPQMAGAQERMIFEQESIGEVLRPGEGSLPEDLDFMKKIEEMKEIKRKQTQIMIEKQKQEELLMLAKQKSKKGMKEIPSGRSLPGKSDNGGTKSRASRTMTGGSKRRAAAA